MPNLTPYLNGLDTLLFDFDGTLAPNLDLADMRRQIAAMSSAAGVPEAVFEDLYIVEIIEAGSAWLSQNIDGNQAQLFAEAAHQRIIDIELAEAATTQVFPGIPNMLSALRDTGFALGVVTRNCNAAVRQVFPEIDTYIDAIHARDDTPYLKPDPRHLSINLDSLQRQPDTTAIVGDGRLDMQTGKALGMRCIGVLTGSNNAEELVAAGADWVIESSLELIY